MHTFKVGDRVKDMTGLVMVVYKMSPNVDMIYCEWYENGERMTAPFHPAELTRTRF